VRSRLTACGKQAGRMSAAIAMTARTQLQHSVLLDLDSDYTPGGPEEDCIHSTRW